MKRQLSLQALEDFPLIRPGDELATVIIACLSSNDLSPAVGDILIVAQKIVSKAENRFVDLQTVTPGATALALAAEVDKDPRLVEVILSESRAVIRRKPGVLITEHRCGWIMANAGVDSSNIAGDNEVLLLPLDADASASRLSGQLERHFNVELGVVISDSFGRPWRVGTTGVALGAAGLVSLSDLRGEPDLYGRPMKTSQQAVADELAAAASLLQGQCAEGLPVVLVRGLGDYVPECNAHTPASVLIREASEDMFR